MYLEGKNGYKTNDILGKINNSYKILINKSNIGISYFQDSC